MDGTIMKIVLVLGGVDLGLGKGNNKLNVTVF